MAQVPREVAGVREASRSRNFGNRKTCVREQGDRTSEPALEYVAVGRQAGRAPELPGEMEHADACLPRQVSQRHGLVEFSLDAVLHPPEPDGRKAAAPDRTGPDRLPRPACA